MSNSRNARRVLIGLSLVAAQVLALPLVGEQSPVHAAAGMNVVKSATPGSGSTVDVDQTITYTVTVANTGDEVLTGLTIDDVVPPGATYVPGSSLISGVSQFLQYRDEFTTKDELDSSNGDTDWSSTSWSLIGADTEIDGVLKLKDDNQATRAVDLVPCVGGTSTVSFEYLRKDDGIVASFDMYNPTDGWVEQAVLSGDKMDNGFAPISQPIPPAFQVAGAQIRFQTDLNSAGGKELNIDNVELEQTCNLITTPIAAGTPPALAPASGGYQLGVGQTAVLTFDVVADGTATSLSNTATVDSDEFGPVVSNAVTHTVSGSAIRKTATTPGGGSTVLQGQTISYEIEIENLTAAPFTDLQVADTLPAGVTYDPGSAKISGARTTVQYLDSFGAQIYNNNDGYTSWTSTPWVEDGDDDPSDPTGGDIEIKNDNGVSPERINVLYVKGDNGVSIRRPMNLGACATGSPTLSFDWRRQDDLTGGKEVYLEYSADNGATWSAPQATFSGAKEDFYRTYSQVIPATYRVAGAQLRFRSSDNNNDKLLYVDNVKVEGLCDVIAPLTTAAAPPDLVLASSHYAVAPGETATVTFQATVDTLGSGVGTLDLDNTATATFAGGPTLTSNTVTTTVVTLPSFTGTVYFDKDNNGSLNAGDPATGATMWAKLVPATGDAIKAAVVDPATGTYTIPLVPAGTYSVIIDDNNTLTDTTPTAPATWSNAAPATGSRTGVVSGGDGAADVTGLDFGLTRSADLELTKTVSATTAYVGGSVAYTLSLTNNGPQPTADVVVTDQLPAGLTYVSQSGTGTYVPATGEWTVPNVANGQTVTLTILASVSGPLTVDSVVTNSAEVTDSLSRDSDSTPGNGSTTEDDDDSAAFTVVAPPTAEVAVTKTVDVTDAGAGDIVAYTITVTNNGPDAISGGVLNDVLPSSLDFQTYSTTPVASGVYDPSTGTWNFGSLANGQTRTLRINAKVLAVSSPTQPLNVTNTATVDIAPVVDPISGNDTASATFGLPYADLSLTMKIDGQDSITADVLTEHTFTLTLTNAGPNPATDVVIDDLLPSGFTFLSATASNGTYSTFNQGLWTIPEMPVGTATLDILARVNSGGLLSNTAELMSVDAFDPDSTPGNGVLTEDDIDTVTLTVTGSASARLPGAVCFAIADSNNVLTRIVRDTGVETAIGTGLGADTVESSALDPFDGALYTWGNGFFREVDLLTGTSTIVGTGLGGGQGWDWTSGTNTTRVLATRSFNDVDGMHFDPRTGFLYAAVRREGTPNLPDLLIRIDPTSGAAVPGAFDYDGDGNGEDFALIEPATGLRDIDGLAVDLDGTLYGVANQGGGGNQTLLRIDTVTGTTTEIGVFYLDTTPESPNDPTDDILMQDIEGMSIDLQGQMYVTTGGLGANGISSGFYDVNKTPEAGRNMATEYFDLTAGDDYEAVACSLPPTDISVQKTVSDSTPEQGSEVTFTITVRNEGPTIATGTSIDDVLPAGLTLETQTASRGTYDPGTGVWSSIGLAVGATATLTVTATVTAPFGTTIVNTAKVAEYSPGVVHMDQADSDDTNNSDSAELYVGVTLADIRGTVFDDIDGDDSISSGDGTIAGVLIELFRDDDDDGIPDGDPIATTTTLGDGTYVFEDLPNGTYLVVETDPASHASVSDIDGPNDNTISVVLDGNGVDSNDNDFLDVALDYGDAPITYGTASAKISPLLSLGAGVTPDDDGRYDDADADDGVDFQNATVTSSGYTLDVTVTNTTGESVWVCGWIDTDADAEDRGTFETSERQCVEVEAEEGVDEYTASLTWTGVGGLDGSSFSRFRVAPTEAEAQADTGTSGIGEVEDYPVDLATLPVTVAYFSTTKADDRIDVTWWSGTESRNAGYVIYAGNNKNKLVPLTELIPGAGDSFEPLEYTASVSTDDKKLWLADVDLTGKETLHGPYRVGRTVGSVPAPIAVDWTTSQAEAGAAESAANAELIAEQNLRTSVGAAAASTIRSVRQIENSSAIGAGNSAAVSVETAGLYRISFDDLMAAGMDWSNVKMKSLAVIDAAGQPVPIRTNSNKKFGPGRWVEFWGEPVDTLYTGTNVYRLVVDKSMRLEMDRDRSKAPRRNATTVGTYLHTEVVEEQNLYSPTAPGEDPWYGFNMFSFGLPHETVVELDHVAAGAGSVSVEMWGAFDFEPVDDHDVAVAVNGVAVGDIQFGGTSQVVLTAEVPDGVLVDGANTVTVTVNVADGMPFGWVNLDHIAVTYPREIRVVDGSAQFTTSARRISVSGLTSPSVRILRLDGDGVTQVVRKRVVLQPDGTYRLSFTGTGASASYAVTQVDSLPQPNIVAGRTPSGLLNGQADLLIISHSTFSAHLGDLVATREAQGLDVKVVEVEDLYAAYTGEVLDPAAISAYIADAAVVFDDPAILLVGADSYDYRDFAGTGSISFIPTLYGDVGVGDVPWSPIDPAFVDLDDDQVPDLPLGRLPVRNLAELSAVIAKTISYTPDASAVFSAEQGFSAAADEIAAAFPTDTDVATAYLDDLTVADARTALLGGINDGAGLTVYFGHSSTEQWGSEGLLTTADAATLTNTDDPTIVVQFGCWNTYFSEPTLLSLGTALSTSAGGAAAVLGATTLTDASHDAMFGPVSMKAFSSEATIGEAMTAAKRELARVTSAVDITMGWTLLGDPTMPLR